MLRIPNDCPRCTTCTGIICTTGESSWTLRLVSYDYRMRSATHTSAYTLANRPDKALKAYEKAHAWRELFALALEQQLPKSAIDEMCERVSEHLASRGKRLEAAQLLVDHAGDIDTAVDILCRGSEFGEAYRLVHLHKRTDLLDSAVLPGLEQAQEDLVEVFDEMRGQLEKEMARLQALRRAREEDPG